MKWDVNEFRHLDSYIYPSYRYQFEILLRTYIRESFLLLDAGCGPKGGYLTIIPGNIQGIALDISHINIKNSIKILNKKNKKISFILGDIEKIPFKEDIFHIIMCKDVLEHIKNKDNAIREFAVSLKKGGKIILSTTNAFNISTFIDNMLPKIVSKKIIQALGGSQHYERQGRLNPWNIKKKLIKHGMSVKNLLMIGYPLIGNPFIYHFSQIKIPKIYYFWIVHNKITEISILKYLKEIMIIAAEKTSNLTPDMHFNEYRQIKY